MVLALFVGALIISQVAAYRMVATFGKSAHTNGIPYRTGIFYNPISSVTATTGVAWMCYGPHALPPAPPKNGGVQFTLFPTYAWGAGCSKRTVHAFARDVGTPLIIASGITLAITLGIAIAGFCVRGNSRQSIMPPRIPPADLNDPTFRLYLGRATGRFMDFGHGAGITRGSPVVLRGDDCAQNVVVFGGTGAGKALDVDCPVLTPVGYRRMGDLRVGDLVMGRNGLPTRVLGVYPQGVKPAFQITFNDGVSTVCCDEHLWNVTTNEDRDSRPLIAREPIEDEGRTARPEQVLSLRQIRTAVAGSASRHLRFAIPIVEPIQFLERSLPLDPYTLGLFIGDEAPDRHSPECAGCGNVFALVPTSPAKFCSDCQVATQPQRHWEYARRSAATQTQTDPIGCVIQQLGLAVPLSNTFIPHDFKFAHVDARLALLQGLLDSSGFVASSRNVEYTTVSEQLADDVMFLIQSLGGTARKTTQALSFIGKESRVDRQSYCLAARLPKKLIPFRLERKVARYIARTKYPVLRQIERIEPVADRHMVCIAVDAPDQLYVVDGCVVTHNTIYCLNRMFEQALEQDCGLLVFDVKGDYGNTIRALAERAGRAPTLIGVGGRPCNLLAGLTPQTASSFLKSAMLLTNTSANSSVWINWATDLANANLGVLEYMPGEYSLHGLGEAVFTADGRLRVQRFIETKNEELAKRMETPGPDADAALIEMLSFKPYANYIENVYPRFPENLQESIKAGLTQVLQLFALPEIDKAFCQGGPDALSMQEVLDGGAFLLDLPIAKYGLGAKTIYTFVKLRFFNVIERRRSEPTWNQTRPVVFGCDEYQELISASSQQGLSDTNFWSMSRSAKCIGIISAQGMESFVASIGNPVLTRATLQNFRQKICFRTEDELTIKYFSYILGDAEVEFDTISRTDSRGSSATGSTKSVGESESESVREQGVINPQMFRRLDRGEAVCLLSIDGAAFDDVLTMQPRGVTPLTRVPVLTP